MRAMVRVAPTHRAQAAPADARQPPRLHRFRMEESRVSKVTERNDTITLQAKITHRTPSSLSHAFSTPVVRELPSLPSAALGSAQTW
jgi:hypothetical protein